MSTQAVAGNWWNASLAEVGVTAMDRTLSPDAGWEEILQSGREEFDAASKTNQMAVGKDRRILDVGCGVGRLSFVLAEHFRDVVGIDISPSLIEQAQSANRLPNLQFATVSGSPLLPNQSEAFDSVFSNEVFYYLDWRTLANYSRDAHRLLKPGGEYVFQLNMQPIPVRTRASWLLRQAMYRCGIKTWRGWSNHKGFTRHYHPRERVQAMLESLGFEDVKIRVGRSIRQTWFTARKRR